MMTSRTCEAPTNRCPTRGAVDSSPLVIEGLVIDTFSLVSKSWSNLFSAILLAVLHL